MYESYTSFSRVFNLIIIDFTLFFKYNVPKNFEKTTELTKPIDHFG